MRVTLLGTGAADGWPNPFCTCASCLAAAEHPRGQTAALVDEDLLLDCGPETARAAVRHGARLAGVKHVVLTHSHPDHTSGLPLLYRSWAGRRDPLDVVGPPSALEAVRDWVAPEDPVRFVPARPGECVQLGRREILAHRADHDDDALLYTVDARLLYATDTASLPASVMTGCYDVVLLELTGAGDGHLDESGFAAALAELRRHGAVSDATRVVAVHVGHANPPPAELERRLTDWGAQLLPDGAVIEAGAPPAAQSRLPRRVLILGGARSGKSREAERRLAAEPVVTYVATGLPNPADPEWSARIAWHRANRPAHWRTLETLDVAAVLRSEPGPLLVDCFSLWLAAHLGDEAAANDLLTAWRDSDCRVVAVSNEVGSGVVPASAAGRAFRDELGRLNARLAATADEVWLMHAGLAQRLR